MSSFDDSDSRPAATTRPFDDDGYLGYDSPLSSQRFDSFTNFADNESVKDSVDDSVSYTGDEAFSSQPIPETPSPPSVFAASRGFPLDHQAYSSFSPELNGKGIDENFAESDGTILPPPSEMQPEEGFALREWRRLNAIRLEEKEKREKELLNQIIDEADEYKIEFHRRRAHTIETNKSNNRDKEKFFLSNQEKFHTEAGKNYWKATGELIPHEMPAIEKKRGKKDKDKKPSIVVIQGPKPGKPTDLSRMRQVLVKLKHNPPSHMKTSQPQPQAPTNDSKTGVTPAASTTPPQKAVAAA